MANLEPMHIQNIAKHLQGKVINKDSYLAHFLMFCKTEPFYILKNNLPGLKSKKNPLLKNFLYRNLKSLRNPSLSENKQVF